MGSSGPLDQPELLHVERLLDARDLAEAQRCLYELGSSPKVADGVAYLTRRLLHLRGRLDGRAVADRLRDLIRKVGHFPEASRLLDAAERGDLDHRDSARPQAAIEQPTPAQESNPPNTERDGQERP